PLGLDNVHYGATSVYQNRTLSAMASANLSSAAYVYGGIDTAHNGTLSVSDELWELETNTNGWLSSTNTTQHQTPPSYNAIIFEAFNNDPLGTSIGVLYLIGGCNTTATAFDPTDVTGCLPMDKVYKIWVSEESPKSAGDV
ncbi:hypothetical protein BG000_011713, partial [Podila horticola]